MKEILLNFVIGAIFLFLFWVLIYIILYIPAYPILYIVLIVSGILAITSLGALIITILKYLNDI